MAATIKVLSVSLVLLYLLQSAVVVRAEYCGRQYCSNGCCVTSDTRCCPSIYTVTGYAYSLTAGVIVAIVIGCLVFIGSIIGCIVCCVRGCCYRPAPVVYSQHAVPPTTVVNTASMSPGTVYPYPQAQQYPMTPTNYPHGAYPYTPQQPAQYNPAFSPEHGQQPPAYTPNKY